MITVEPMDSLELRQLVVAAIESMKGQDIAELDVRKLTDVTDYMVIASGRSRRQVLAIAEKVITTCKQRGMRPLGIEGEDTGDWVLVDLVDVVVHIMEPEIRDYYQLEKLWTGHEAPGRPGERLIHS